MTTAVFDPAEPQGWSDRITATWRQSVEAIIETGRLLAEAKAALPHGAFQAMIESSLPFKASTARRLMIVGADERILNRAHVHVLPPHWGTLYEITKLDAGTFEAKVADGTINPNMERRHIGQSIKKARRDDKVRDLGDKQRALPDKKYGVILADPEWPFEVWSEETGQDRAAANHYPTSTFDVIGSRPVASIAADECVLGLWATVPKLPAAIDVLREWGFTYVTHIAWIKDRSGTGYWFRNNHEILLIGKKGKPPKPADGTQWRSSIAAPRGAHSEKPNFQYEFFETFFPGWPAIELNARRRRDGWDAWGLEAPPDHIAGARKMAESYAAAIDAIPEEVFASTYSASESQAKADVEAKATNRAPQGEADAESVSRLAGGRTPARGGSSPVDDPPDIELPDSLRRVAMTEDERALIVEGGALERTFASLNDRLFIRKLRDNPAGMTALDRRHLAKIAAKQSEAA